MSSHDAASADALNEVTQPPDGGWPDAYVDAPVDNLAAESDAPRDPPIPCEDLKAEWQAFVESHRTCVVDSDCELVGGSTDYCNCAVSIGDPGGDPISKSAVPSAKPYLDSFNLCHAAGYYFGCAWDHGPSKDLRCSSGICAATSQYCGPADAG